MKIALVVSGGLHPSGREQVIPALLALVERLAREHEVHAFALRHLPNATRYSLAGATVHDLGRPHGRWRQSVALRHALPAAGPFDIIHGYWVDPAGLLAAVAARRLNVPSVVTCDSGEFAALPSIGYGLQASWRGRAAVALACRMASAVHVCSKFMEALAASHGVRAHRIPLSIDVRRVGTAGAATGPPWRLLQVASLNLVKDQSTLLRALAIARRSVDVQLDLVGEDTLGGQLQRQAAALEISGAVNFHGFVAQDGLGPLRHAAHLYVQSSLHEAAGVAVLEAAAAGLPIVGTRVGFVSDWDGTAALGVPPADPQALATAILRLLSDAARRRQLAGTARHWVEQHDADYSAREMVELYRTLLTSRIATT